MAAPAAAQDHIHVVGAGLGYLKRAVLKEILPDAALRAADLYAAVHAADEAAHLLDGD